MGAPVVGEQQGSSPILRTARLADDETMTTNPMEQSSGQVAGPLRRPYHGRILAGVAAGIAEYLAVDVSVVRIGFVVLSLLGGLGIPAYIAGWLLVPDEEAQVSIVEDWLQRHQQRAA